MVNPAPLDYQGLACPEPVVRLHALLKENKPDQLQIFVDNEAANENIARALAHYGYSVQSTTDGTIWELNAQNTTAPLSTESLPTQVTANQGTYRTLILLTNDTLGHGDDVLGARLMESFLATLPEMDENLWRIILLNAGAKLAATQGKCLESLKRIEASGVDILVCGSCLMFYGLIADKAVGDTTNMLDVIASLDVADKVIRP